MKKKIASSCVLKYFLAEHRSAWMIGFEDEKKNQRTSGEPRGDKETSSWN